MLKKSDAFELGAEYIAYNGYTILMYNKERMLLFDDQFTQEDRTLALNYAPAISRKGLQDE